MPIGVEGCIGWFFRKGRGFPKERYRFTGGQRVGGLEFVGLLGEISDIVKKNFDLIDITHSEGGSLIEKKIEATGILIYEK
jgi:hypothetical protein